MTEIKNISIGLNLIIRSYVENNFEDKNWKVIAIDVVKDVVVFERYTE